MPKATVTSDDLIYLTVAVFKLIQSGWSRVPIYIYMPLKILWYQLIQKEWRIFWKTAKEGMRNVRKLKIPEQVQSAIG